MNHGLSLPASRLPIHIYPCPRGYTKVLARRGNEGRGYRLFRVVIPRMELPCQNDSRIAVELLTFRTVNANAGSLAALTMKWLVAFSPRYRCCSVLQVCSLPKDRRPHPHTR